MIIFSTGDRVRLTEKVLHPGFRNVCGTVIKTVKSRGVVVICCDNGKRYEALLKNVERKPDSESEAKEGLR